MSIALQTFLILLALAATSLFSFAAGYTDGLMEEKGLKIKTRILTAHKAFWCILWFATLASGIAVAVQFLTSL
jgi:hypothetical protein